MSGIRIDEETGCWVWERYIELGSAPKIQINRAFGGESWRRRRHYRVNHMVYQLVAGELPEEPFSMVKKPGCYYMDRCVNPFHSDVRLLTPKEDRYSKKLLEKIRKPFALNVVIDMRTSCWHSPSLDTNATGMADVNDQQASWLLYRGDLPQDARLQNMCQSSGCCNPVHLTLQYIPVIVDLVDRLDDEPLIGDPE